MQFFLIIYNVLLSAASDASPKAVHCRICVARSGSLHFVDFVHTFCA